MTRFSDVDLSRLPAPPAIESLDYEAIRAASLAELVQRLQAADIAFDVSGLETDPAAIIDQARSYREALMRQRINDAIADVLLTTSQGGMLDHLGWPHTARLVLDPGDPSAAPPRPAVMEDDEAFRRRIQLAWEATSTAGPPGAYEYLALSAHPEVADALALGPEVEGVEPGEAHVVALSRAGTGIARRDLLLSVAAKVQAFAIRTAGGPLEVIWDAMRRQRQDVRPLTDKVIVRSAEISTYRIRARITVIPGPDAGTISGAARTRVEAYAASRRRIGLPVERFAIGAALSVVDELGRSAVYRTEVMEPAGDIAPGPFGAAHCSSIEIETEVLDG